MKLQGSVPTYPANSNVQVTAGKRHSLAFFERPSHAAALWERNGKPSFDPVWDNLLLRQSTHISIASLTQHACVDSLYLPDTVTDTELHIAGLENILGNSCITVVTCLPPAYMSPHISALGQKNTGLHKHLAYSFHYP